MGILKFRWLNIKRIEIFFQGPIPNVPKELIEFLEREENISTEGIFRRSSSNQQTRDSLAIYNQGKMMGDTLNDPILAAGMYFKKSSTLNGLQL